MSNFSDLFSKIEGNEMVGYYLKNAEKNAYTNFSTSILNVRLAIEEISEEIFEYENRFHDEHNYYNHFLVCMNYVFDKKRASDRPYFDKEKYDKFCNAIDLFYDNMPGKIRDRCKAHRLAYCCFFLIDDYTARGGHGYENALKAAKQIIYIYHYACTVIMHTGATKQIIIDIDKYTRLQESTVDFKRFDYLIVLFKFFKNLFGISNMYFDSDKIPIQEPIEEWHLVGKRKEIKFTKYTTRSGIYEKIGINNSKRDFAMITYYEATQYKDATKDITHFFATYEKICTSRDFYVPRLSSTKICNIGNDSNDIGRILVYQYFDSEPHMVSELINDSSFTLQNRIKISYEIGNILSGLHKEKIYIRTLTDESIVLVKIGKEYIPYLTGLKEAKNIEQSENNLTTIATATEFFKKDNPYCAPEVLQGAESYRLETFGEDDWKFADFYSYAVLVSYLIWGKHSINKFNGNDFKDKEVSDLVDDIENLLHSDVGDRTDNFESLLLRLEIVLEEKKVDD